MLCAPRVDQLLYVMRKIYRNILETLRLCVLIKKHRMGACNDNSSPTDVSLIESSWTICPSTINPFSWLTLLPTYCLPQQALYQSPLLIPACCLLSRYNQSMTFLCPSCIDYPCTFFLMPAGSPARCLPLSAVYTLAVDNCQLSITVCCLPLSAVYPCLLSASACCLPL